MGNTMNMVRARRLSAEECAKLDIEPDSLNELAVSTEPQSHGRMAGGFDVYGMGAEMMTLTIRGHGRFEVADLAEASLVYQRVRDESGEGGSTFGPGRIVGAAGPHYVSYNGRVWRGRPQDWQAGAVPVMEAQS